MLICDWLLTPESRRSYPPVTKSASQDPGFSLFGWIRLKAENEAKDAEIVALRRKVLK